MVLENKNTNKRLWWTADSIAEVALTSMLKCMLASCNTVYADWVSMQDSSKEVNFLSHNLTVEILILSGPHIPHPPQNKQTNNTNCMFDYKTQITKRQHMYGKHSTLTRSRVRQVQSLLIPWSWPAQHEVFWWDVSMNHPACHEWSRHNNILQRALFWVSTLTVQWSRHDLNLRTIHRKISSYKQFYNL